MTPSLFRIILTLPMLLLLSACSREPQVEQHTVFVFGTLVEITLTGVEKGEAESAFLDVERQLLDYHSQWTPWEEDSDLSRLNKAIKDKQPLTIPPSLEPLIRESRIHYRSSEGLFNPAIGGLIKLWQFHRHDEPGIQPPDDEAIQALLRQAPAIDDIEQDGDMAHSSNSRVDLNFGAFAKGYAIEQAIATLADVGIENAIINAGGDLVVAGSKQQRNWRIGIRHPREEGTIASLNALPGEAVFTSGDYERYYVHEGKRYNHILDPRTGYPAMVSQSVTVIDTDPGKADAAATALFVAGPEDWHRIARSMGIRYAMLIDAEGTIYMNPAMQKRLRFENAADLNIVLSEPLYYVEK